VAPSVSSTFTRRWNTCGGGPSTDSKATVGPNPCEDAAGLGPSAVQPAVSSAKAPSASQPKFFLRQRLLARLYLPAAIVTVEGVKDRIPTGVCAPWRNRYS
jgi:hypothetical protein